MWSGRCQCLGAMMVVLLMLGPGVSGLKCYNCNNCIKYELSQSQTCNPEHTRCMKMDMQTGQVQRSCGTEEMCTNSETELKNRYKAVNCCGEDNCNGSRHLTPASLLLVILPAALVTATRGLLTHC
ncbi:uncharacterized protein [Penaeus vannamei]|uniref:uncharacterized protein n=1 Tax=Penaeus vannamei TaxID=6689 RepID=UPI00387F94D3